jgi:hypothetical protein
MGEMPLQQKLTQEELITALTTNDREMLSRLLRTPELIDEYTRVWGFMEALMSGSIQAVKYSMCAQLYDFHTLVAWLWKPISTPAILRAVVSHRALIHMPTPNKYEAASMWRAAAYFAATNRCDMLEELLPLASLTAQYSVVGNLICWFDPDKQYCEHCLSRLLNMEENSALLSPMLYTFAKHQATPALNAQRARVYRLILPLIASKGQHIGPWVLRDILMCRCHKDVIEWLNEYKRALPPKNQVFSAIESGEAWRGKRPDNEEVLLMLKNLTALGYTPIYYGDVKWIQPLKASSSSEEIRSLLTLTKSDCLALVKTSPRVLWVMDPAWWSVRLDGVTAESTPIRLIMACKKKDTMTARSMRKIMCQAGGTLYDDPIVYQTAATRRHSYDSPGYALLYSQITGVYLALLKKAFENNLPKETPWGVSVLFEILKWLK